MKLKKLFKYILFTTFLLISMMSTQVNAAELSPSLYFGITELRESGLGYSIKDPASNGTTGSAAKIWNIVQYSGPNATGPTEANVYCIKAGVGFTEGNGTKEIQEYNRYFNMYTEREAIASQDENTNRVLYNLVNGGHYNELLAIANLIYIPGESTEADKEALLKASGVLAYQQEYAELGENYKLTDDEIEAVQQAAIWYFTNYGEENGKYDNLEEEAWLFYTEDGTEYKALSSYGNTENPTYGTLRREQAVMLYRYLINEAKEQASNYAEGTGHYKHKLTLYTTATGNSQPLMKVERNPDFDLALRKYITEVNGVTVSNTRVPAIDETSLTNGTTATYKHRKDPVTVENGDIVTYNITIYNEGEVDGRATEITDQLPAGLRFSKLNTAGFTAQYTETTNTVVITRDDTNTENLTAYTNGNLDSETIELECIVDSTVNGQVLTNVAWISDAIDEDGNIIDQVGDDRDSEPGTTPNVNQNSLVSTDNGYIGNTNNSNKELSNSEEYFEGEQDDDDFEKLIVRYVTGSYQLQLQKVDNNGTIINAGAEFGWTLPGQSEQTGTTTNGTLSLGTVNITDVSTTDTITIREITAPEGYNKLIDSLTIQVVKAEENNSYVAKDVQITAGQVEGATAVLNGNVITITVPNIPVDGNYQLQLEKVDQNGTLITTSGAEFGWTLPGQTEEQTGTTNNGVLNLGLVTITDTTNPDTITIREIKAPTGYKKLVESITVEVTKGEENGNYKPTGAQITSSQSNGATVSLTGNVITVRIPNEGQNFDLALRKFIIAVSDNETIEDGDYLRNTDGSYTREPQVDSHTLNARVSGISEDENGNITDMGSRIETTAKYNHTKEPVSVKRNDYVVYMIRVYNEGEQNGYAAEIKDHLPPYLSFVDNEFNQQYGWAVSEDGRTVTTRYLENSLLSAAVRNDGQYDIDYAEVPIMCRVSSNVIPNENITNIADITEYQDELRNPVIDRDSQEDNVELPTDENLPSYQDDKMNQEYIPGQQDDDDFEKVYVEQQDFDLALRKFISEVDGTQYDRAPSVDLSGLTSGTTAIYNHTKEPVLVKRNSVIIYTLRIYNEGEVDGYAEEVTDYLPSELEFLPEHATNIQYEWQVSEDGRTVTTDYLSSAKETVERENKIDAFDGTTLDYKEVKIACRVKEEAKANINLTNLAEITEDSNEDRDSTPGNIDVPTDENLPSYKDDEINKDYVPGQQDDDDFEKVYVQDFDLALRKFISEVDGTQYNRAPSVDLSGLTNGTTAIYNHTKEPVFVKRSSVVIYTIRVYNEGDIDGYAEEVTDYLPSGLEFLPEHTTNVEYEWQVSEDGRTVTTDYLSSVKETTERQNLIKAFDGTTLDYKEVKIACKVKEEASTDVKLTNLAEITEDKNEEGIPDIDSTPDNIEIPTDDNLPGYKDDEINKDYVPGQQDDDDFEKVILQEFDLALRKFITKVDEEDVTTRIPEVSYNRDENQITYNHTKDPVEVVTGDIVEYTIRIYNEGEIAGYAKEVADDIPDGLKYLPDNTTNIEYRWVMYDSDGNITENSEEAVEIRTDYLSKEQEATDGENLLQAFNPDAEIGEGNPDYRDIKVAFEVVEPNESDRIIVNSAQITEDTDENGNPVDDKDSIPDEWNEGEDDQDREYIKLTYFDLALRKWVTEAIVIENGQETITQTGHTAEMDPEPVVKVELYRKNLNDVTVKFRYSIRITNEGDIAGYATEITDYVPAGLRFVAEDNPGWTDEGNNVISTRLLENTLLQPGESAEVEVVLTWINGEDNMGQMTNIAEISEDYNDKGAPDRDSTPDNQVWGEDDIDDAPVLLSIETGQARIYFVLGFTVLGTLAVGLILIKKYVI